MAVVPPNPPIEIRDDTPPPYCLFCHTQMQWNAKRTAPDGIAWESVPPKGSDYVAEDLGWTHYGACAEGHAQACEYMGLKVNHARHKMLVSYDG